MASSRVTYAVLFVALSLTWMADANPAFGSCGPWEAMKSAGPAWNSYLGRIGQVTRPFAVAGDFIEFDIGGCKTGQPFDATKLPRTFFVIDQNVAGPDAAGKKRPPSILIIEPGATTKKCEELETECTDHSGGKIKDAKCVPANQVLLQDGHLRVGVPDVAKQLKQARGPVRVAVRPTATSLQCLALVDEKACANADPSNGWHVCVDEIFESAACTSSRDDFASVTMLPPWNEFKAACFEQSPPCSLDEGHILEYAIDADKNMLIPVNWQTLLASCGGNPKACAVSGAIKPALGLSIELPINLTADKNENLESFTPAGDPNKPAFAADFNVPAGMALVVGQADEKWSVLRVRARADRCVDSGTGKSTGKGCRRNGRCPSGSKCKDICVGGRNAGEPCDGAADCNGGKCGFSHDLNHAEKDGHWKFERKAPGFCQASIVTNTCSKDSDCAPCVGYQARAADAKTFDVPQPTPTSDPAFLESFGAFIASGSSSLLATFAKELAAAVGNLRLVRSSDAAWVAAYLESPRVTTVLVARSACDQAKFCDPTSVVLASPLISNGIAFAGGQLRLLTEEAGGDGKDGQPRIAELWVADASRLGAGEAARPTRVGRVILGVPGYDPLDDPDGGAGTRFLTPSGRCVADGNVLSAPSYCRPTGSDCPPPAACVAQDVVVAIDLRTDSNGDGIPDVLQQR